MVYSRHSLLQLLLFIPFLAGAQDTLVVTDTVRITGMRDQLLSPGSGTWQPDTIDQWVSGGSQLDQLLMLGSTSYVRSYGGGNISLLSVRGGTAEQTLVTWNGVPVNQSGSGLCDLSLIPFWMVGASRLETGGNGLRDGNGAVNGTLLLEQDNGVDPGVSARFRSEYATSGRFAGMGQIRLGSRSWQADFRYFQQFDANRFPFPDGDSIRINVHGDIWQSAAGGMVRRFFGARSYVTWNGFWTGMQRLISPVRAQLSSAAWQGDTLVRNSFEWVYATSPGTLRITGALNQDLTRYVQPWIHTDARSMFRSYHGLGFWESSNPGAWCWGADAAVHLLTASVDEYGVLRSMTRFGVGGWASYRPDSAAMFTGGLRYEAQSGKIAPLLPTVSLENRFGNFTVHFRGSRTYRMPTLNMLYWQPGGNENLRPERGWSFTGGVNWEDTNPGQIGFRASVNLYSQHLNYMMQWRPADAGYWAPVNIGKVWSRGGEMMAEWTFRSRSWMLACRAWGSLTRATDQSPESALRGKQLMYVPLLNAGTRICLQTGTWLVVWNMPWTGMRYTQPDESWWLPWNMTGNLSAAWTSSPGNTSVTAGLRVNNIWNEEYEMMAGRPMPGRTCTIFLEINLEKKSN